MLMGSADVAIMPATKTIFLEDLGEAEKAKLVLPAGLVNLGNTCYMNSTLQCIRRCDSFRDGLTSGLAASPNKDPFVKALDDTLNQLDRSTTALQPFQFVGAMRSSYPQFGEQGRGGGFKQQDAEEFFSAVFNSSANQLGRRTGAFKQAYGGQEPSNEQLGGADNLVDSMFGLKMEDTLTCPEAGDLEPPVRSYDLQRKLVCNIQGGHGSTVQIDHIADGVSLALNSELEKNSDALGRNAVWKKESKVDRLPKYLCIQFMRFYWKQTPESRDHTGVKCKMLRQVTFQDTFDVYDHCSDRLQTILKVGREKALAEEDERVKKKMKMRDEGEAKPAAEKEAEAEDDMDEETKAAMAMSMETSDPIIVGPCGAGLPTEFQGMYELFGVVTHKGRDAESGHYMGWVRQDAKDDGNGGKTNDDWLVFDDDEVSVCKTEDVIKLKGGGDRDMSYLNFYRAKE
jgi:ubiquitin carboxyl-terminal hydrolase 14